MARIVAITAAVTGLASALAGFVWVGLEFPFAILLPAVLGLLAATLLEGYDPRRAWLASVLGGIGFTVAFLVAVFLALTDGSPLALPAWAGALLAAAVAGAVTGGILEGRRGIVNMSALSAAGMVAGIVIVGLMRYLAPGSVDTAGPAQTLYFTVAIGLVGTVMGAAMGLGVERIRSPR